MAIECMKPTIKVIKLQKDGEYPAYAKLTEEEKEIAEEFAKVRDKLDKFFIKMIHLESSVQLVFYLTVLLVNLNEIPILQLNYNESRVNLASTKWIFGLIWFLVKTLLSGYTTFSSIFHTMKKESYRSTGFAPSIIQYVSVVLSVLVELIFASSTTFLLWSKR